MVVAVLSRLVPPIASALALTAAATGCDGLTPSFHPCAITCGAGGACPSGYLCADDDYCHAETEFPIDSCVAPDADAAVVSELADAGAPDAAPPDASQPPDAGPPTCDLGTAANLDAVTNPFLFNQVVAFAGGDELAAGTYRLTYLDGCIKYGPGLWWSVHGRAGGDATWWLVSASAADGLILLPGTVGMLPGTAGPTGDRNGFERFDDCVTANQQLDPVLYEHAGGRLGIYLTDIDYGDNQSGEGGRNPKWRLEYLGPCSDLTR